MINTAVEAEHHHDGRSSCHAMATTTYGESP